MPMSISPNIPQEPHGVTHARQVATLLRSLVVVIAPRPSHSAEPILSMPSEIHAARDASTEVIRHHFDRTSKLFFCICEDHSGRLPAR